MGYDADECMSCYARIHMNEHTDCKAFRCFKCLPVSSSSRVISTLVQKVPFTDHCESCNQYRAGYEIPLCKNCGGKDKLQAKEDNKFLCLECLYLQHNGFIAPQPLDMTVYTCNKCDKQTYGYFS